MDPIFLGIPVLNRADLLEECLRRIDVPVQLFIVNNNTVDEEFQQRLEVLRQRFSFKLHQSPRNLGVAASWNLILREGYAAGFDPVFITANDFHVDPGMLMAFVQTVRSFPAELFLGDGFNLFSVPRATAEKVGYFDENFYPAYFEDNDYVYRCRLAGARILNFGTNPRQEDGREIPGLVFTHVGSQTIRSDAEYGKRNEWTFPIWNRTHYELKWGGGPDKEKFKTPYNKAEHDWRWWPPPAGSIEHRDWDQDRKRVR